MVNTDHHAYLIMSHSNLYNLEILLKMLDDKRNDIFLHIDKKAKNIQTDQLKKIVTHANFFIFQDIKVNWGGFSQVKCELFLLKRASEYRKHTFYHLLSSSDLPVKTQDYIYDFFKRYPDKQFIQFDDERLSENKDKIYNRLKFYYPLQEIRKGNKFILVRMAADILAELLKFGQKIINIDRLRDLNMPISFGSQWFSINQALTDYILSKETEIYRIFRSTGAPDELFLQMMIVNTTWKEQVYTDENGKTCNMRLICWDYQRDANHPRLITGKDKKLLESSQALFARKFSETFDRDIINWVYMKYKN